LHHSLQAAELFAKVMALDTEMRKNVKYIRKTNPPTDSAGQGSSSGGGGPGEMMSSVGAGGALAIDP
jgi:hypothetical protein